jgi:PAS domain-containing protein
VWGAPFALLVLDDSRQQRVEYANEGAAALFGRGYLDLFGTEGHDLVARDEQAQARGRGRARARTWGRAWARAPRGGGHAGARGGASIWEAAPAAVVGRMPC